MVDYLWLTIVLSIVGLILFFIFSRPRFRIPGLSSLSLFLAILIFIAATVLFNVLWDDIGELVLPEGRSYYSFLPQRFDVLLAHTLYVLPLLAVAIILYLNLEKKGVKYRAVTFPYLGAAGIMVIRLLVEAGSLMVARFAKAGIYGILISALVVFTLLIFYVQRRREEQKKEERAS